MVQLPQLFAWQSRLLIAGDATLLPKLSLGFLRCVDLCAGYEVQKQPILEAWVAAIVSLVFDLSLRSIANHEVALSLRASHSRLTLQAQLCIMEGNSPDLRLAHVATPLNSLFNGADGAAKDALKTAKDVAGNVANTVGMAADDALSIAGEGLDSARQFAADTASNAANAIGSVVNSAISTVNRGVENQRRKAEETRRREIDESEAFRQKSIAKLEIANAEEMLEMLGVSPIPLTPGNMTQIKECFPIPREHNILWADAEFDLRPSGVALTDAGVFVKTDAVVFANPFAKGEGQSTTSSLYLITWEYFDPECFAVDDNGNYALSVDKRCSERFLSVCQRMVATGSLAEANCDEQVPYEVSDKKGMAATIGAAAVLESEVADLAEKKAHINTLAGHGEMAEEANTILDKFLGHDAKVIGYDHAKNGADRKVDGIFVQTKYHNCARSTLESAFDHETGFYRYVDESGSPMQLEVPKDQYDRVLEGFKEKIKQGRVPGVKDPAEAESMVRRGHLTHKQAVNLTKPGKIESLAYDAATGAVICSCAFGISFVAATYNAYRKTNNLEESVQAGLVAGVQVFGMSFLQHILVSQIARTNAAKLLMTPSQFVVEKLGYKASQALVNSIRALSGKSAISGAAASKQLAKILRSNVVTTAITLAVFSVPEVYDVVNKRISNAQYAKNMAALTGSVLGGAGGAVAAGAAAAKVAGAVGTGIAPGVGTAVGLVGGLVGGTVGSAAANAASNVLHEGDAVTIGRLLNAYVAVLCVEYMLDDDEVALLSEELDKISQDDFRELFADFLQSAQQEQVLRNFLEPRFDRVIEQREPFVLPSIDYIDGALTDMLISLN